MSFLSGLANISPIGALTNLFGSNSFNSTAQWGLRPGNNMGGNFGHSLNLWTGATDSANLQYSHNMGLQHDAQEFAKWQMENAHQIETQDLINAGLNPVLSANGGASAGVSANSTGAGTGGTDPIGMISAIVGMMNSTKQVKAIVDKTEAETNNINQDTLNKGQEYELKPQLVQALTKLQNAQSSQAITQSHKNVQEELESQARTIGQNIINKMSEMDVTKRAAFFNQEMEVAKQQLKAQMVTLGFEGSEIYQGIDRAFATAGKLFTGSVNYTYGNNVSHSTNTNNSNVNVNNTNYNPIRKW